MDESHRLAGELARAGERIQTISTQLEATQTQLDQLHQQRAAENEAQKAAALAHGEKVAELKRAIDSMQRRLESEVSEKEAEITALKAKLYDAATQTA